jgi:hypothetical protein
MRMFRPVSTDLMRALLCLLPLSLGCEPLHAKGPCCARKVLPPSPAAPASVLVGGDVHQAGAIAIPAHGLTLAQALALAGGARLDSVPVVQGRDGTRVLNALAALRTAVEQCQAAAAGLLEDCNDEQRNALNTSRRIIEESIVKLVERIDEDLAGAGAQQLVDQLHDLQKPVERHVQIFVVDCDPQAGADLEAALKKFHDALKRIESQIERFTGQVLLAPQHSQRETLLVALQRPAVSRQITYYFPHETIIAGAAGAIPLQNADFVRLIPVTETTLLHPRARSGDSISVRGYVENPGPRRADAATLHDLLEQVKVPNVDPAQLSIVLTRSTADGVGRDVFVIPYAAASDAPFSAVPTVPVDVYEIVPTLRAPLVFETVVDSLVGQAISERIVRQRPNVTGARAHLLSLQRAGDSLEKNTRNSLQRVGSALP